MAVLALVLVPAFEAHATQLPAPTAIASAVTSTYQSPCTTGNTNCADPGVLVAQGVAFLLTVTLTADGAPAAFNKDTSLTLTAPGPGILNQSTVTMPAGVSTWTFDTVSYSSYANGITVTAGVGGKPKLSTIASTPSNAFDVLQSLKTDPASSGVPFQDGAGPNACAVVTSADPVCGYVVLPHGANTDVLLSTGSCAGIGCNTTGTVSQVVADLHGLYNRTDPATLIIECYKTLCGKGGVSKYTPVVSFLGSGPMEYNASNPVPPCPAKGTIGADQVVCTDYVQSTRDNVDDLLLYVLFFDDFRGSI